MARHEGWNTYADGYDSAAKDDVAEFKRLDAEVAALRDENARLRSALANIVDCDFTYQGEHVAGRQILRDHIHQGRLALKTK